MKSEGAESTSGDTGMSHVLATAFQSVAPQASWTTRPEAGLAARHLALPSETSDSRSLGSRGVCHSRREDVTRV